MTNYTGLFVGGYGRLYIIISIYTALRGFAAVFGLVCVYEIGAIHRCYYLYFASVMHEVMILCVLGVDLDIFVCYHVGS